MPLQRKQRLSPQVYIDGILSHNRVIFSQAITLIESQLPSDHEIAQEVLAAILPHTGQSVRLGITGVPGVGKSTFIESLGKHITAQNKKLAVLAVDPSSQISKGSIMGDKTRMEQLSTDPLAYIRPTPAQNSLGGVARRTRETMLVCEAAGFEVIFIETVGVGQSETVVYGMVDFFLLLMLAGAGDELQGIKKGIMEMADALVITKADADNAHRAKVARAEYQGALHLFPPAENGWFPPVLTCSALQNQGINDIWQVILDHQQKLQANGWFAKKRQQQNLNWLHDTIKQSLEERFYQHQAVKNALPMLENAVKNGQIPAISAAWQLLELYEKG
ncbi:MAG: methylmalonyl Co-A mutase-associated GTPase MeaB [Microscillaceae bacterium]|jgi:LAO/AO transport system kinase|nr:methylmalonyl Co-A mutase-associated GTPase MeaB [Microscillaceae bacterium]